MGYIYIILLTLAPLAIATALVAIAHTIKEYIKRRFTK